MTVKFTDLEKMFIEDYKNDEFVGDYGWESEEARAWVDCFSDGCRLNGKQLSGVMSSLVQKGIIETDGEAFCLTSFGIEIVKEQE